MWTESCRMYMLYKLLRFFKIETRRRRDKGRILSVPHFGPRGNYIPMCERCNERHNAQYCPRCGLENRYCGIRFFYN